VAVTPEYVAAFTDAAHAAGMKVIWKPQFVLDNGSNENVNDYSLGPQFYPNGTTFNVETFLANVLSFWTQWSPVAQQHNVEMLILGTEQGAFASAPYTNDWLSVIAAVRSLYSGQLTYAENHFEPIAFAPNVQFWSELDLIGIDDYEPVGNGTANTPYSFAYPALFANTLGLSPATHLYSLPAIFFDLHRKYGKPIFFAEFGTNSADGAMNTPPHSSGASNLTEQATYFQVNFDVWENFSWIAGLSIWNEENEQSLGPGTPGSSIKNTGFEIYGKPAGSVVQGYWLNQNVPPQIPTIDAETIL
jgi:hypothetical protein